MSFTMLASHSIVGSDRVRREKRGCKGNGTKCQNSRSRYPKYS